MMSGLMLWVCCTAGKHRSPYAISLLSAALQQIHPGIEIQLFLPSYHRTSSTEEVLGAAEWLKGDPRWTKKCCDQGIYQMPELTKVLGEVAVEFLTAASDYIQPLQIMMVKEEPEAEEELEPEAEVVDEWKDHKWSEKGSWSQKDWQPTRLTAARERSRSPRPSG